MVTMTWNAALKTEALVLSALLLGCASKKNDVDITKPVSGVEASNAGKAYEHGLSERKEQNPVEAVRYFEFVKNNFPYSQYAALAELAIADMAYDREDWAQAATAYGDFVKSHPSHSLAAYAAYRVGLAHYNDRPSDWFLLPPSYEKDQAPLRAAMDGFSRFLVNYPKSEFVPKAQIELTDCRERLVTHERYVAEFYETKKEWLGAAHRYLSIADSFGDLRDGHLRAEMLWRAAQAYRSFNAAADERATLVRFVQEAPGDVNRPRAEAMIKAIPADAKPPELVPVPIPGFAPLKPVAQKNAPIAPAETPGAPGDRPAAAPSPGVPPGQSLEPVLPESNPKPAGPTNQPATPPETPRSQPATPPLAQPDK
jgi:outer membrane protein assembly factor BamD